MIDQYLKTEVMRIAIDEDTVGELSDDGEITTDDPYLVKQVDKIKHQRLTDLRSRKTKQRFCFYSITVKKGDPGYVSVIADILLDDGYGLKE